MLATLLDASRGAALPLPADLETRYGGPLRLPSGATHVFANFVSTIDGVVSYDAPGMAQAKQVSASYPGDRFVLALLRAAADAVIVGAGTLRKEPGSVWSAASVFPDAAAAFAQLRVALKRPPDPPTILVTTSGDIDLRLPAFHSGVPVVIATTAAGAGRVGTKPDGVTARVLAESGPIAARALVDLAREVSGGTRILTEGGPSLHAQFLAERVLDELFLTIAPRLAGRSKDLRRLALVEGVAFRPDEAPQGELVSLKHADGYLFTRYAFTDR